MDNPPTLPFVALREWRRAELYAEHEDLRGRRAVLVNASGTHYDHRAWTRLLRDRNVKVVWMVTERDWWAYTLTGALPEPVRWPAQAVWIEQE